MTELTTEIQEVAEKLDAKASEYMKLWAYIDKRKRCVGYAYKTKGGGICVKGDQLMDKNQLGKHLIQGLYVYTQSS